LPPLEQFFLALPLQRPHTRDIAIETTIMAIVPITTGTAIANSTTIEATAIITIGTIGTGGIAVIIMAIITIITIIAAIITIDAKNRVPRSRLAPGAKGPWVSIFAVCSCWFLGVLRIQLV
jgi:hypothetical protein